MFRLINCVLRLIRLVKCKKFISKTEPPYLHFQRKWDLDKHLVAITSICDSYQYMLVAE